MDLLLVLNAVKL